MANLNDLADRLKDIFSDDRGWFRQGKFTPGKQITKIAKTAAPVVAEKALQPLASFQKATQRWENTQRIELPKVEAKTKVGSFIKNLPINIAESYANIPRNLLVTSTRLGNLAGEATRGQTTNAGTRFLSGVAPLGESLLDVYAPGAAKTLAKQTGKQLVKQGIKTGIKQGAIEGAGGGALYEIGKDARDINWKDVGTSSLLGAIVGGGAGGAFGGGSAALGQLRKKVSSTIKKLSPDISESQITKETDRFIRDELGRFAGIKKSSKGTHDIKIKEGGVDVGTTAIKNRYSGDTKFYSDLHDDIRKNLGLPESYQSGAINFGAEIGGNKKAREPLYKIQDLKNTKAGLSIKNVSDTGDVVEQAKKQIGDLPAEPKKSFKQTTDEIYTQWVDRYNPLTKASKEAKKQLKEVGAELRPEADPSVLARKLTGAGGIADTRYQNELKPIIDQLDSRGIVKSDMDVYLKAKRDIGLAERGIKGSDANQANKIISSIESKYGPDIRNIANSLYSYQDKGFKELVDSGFISPEQANIIRQKNPDYVPFDRVMDELDNYLGIPTRKTMQGTQPIKKIKGSERQIYSPVESIIANTFKQRAAIEKNNVAKSIVNLQNVADLGFSKAAKSGDSTITIWNNGKKEFWNVGKEIADTAKGLNEENMNTLLKIFKAPASLLRQGATGRNPEFMIPNVIRDQLDAGVTSKYGYVPFLDYLSGLKSMLSNDEIYQKWANSGAKIDLGELSGRKTIQQSFDAKTSKKLKNWISQGLDVLGKYSEQPTRVGLFKKGYKKTGNELLAMMESRDATVDFARMGSKMKTANSIIPFLNVGIQGTDKLFRAVKDNPAKVLLNATIYGTLPAATITAYNIMNYPKEYAEIPQYEKDNNFVIVKGRNDNGTVDYLTVPKGNVIPLIANPIESFISYLAGTNQQTFSQFATQLFGQAMPVVSEGQSLKETATKTIGSNLPQLIKPVTENLVNKSFYKYNTNTEQAKEIVPYYLQNKEPYKQAYEWTPAMYKGIGSVLNVSPLQVQNLMEGYLAGYAKIPAQIIDMMKSVSEGKPIEDNNKTILRRFIKQTYPSTSTNTAKISEPKTGLFSRISKQESAQEQLPDKIDDLSILYKDAVNTIEGYGEKKTKSKYGITDTNLESLQTDVDKAIALKRRIEQEKPEQVFDIQIDTYASGAGPTVPERAKWASEKLSSLKGEELTKAINKMLEGNVLTKSVAEALRDDYGINVGKYTSGGKIKTLGGSGSGKSAKKISIAKISPTRISAPRGRVSTPKGVKITSPANIKMSNIQARKLNLPTNINVPQYKIAQMKGLSNAIKII